jgi:hypothetical protein
MQAAININKNLREVKDNQVEGEVEAQKKRKREREKKKERNRYDFAMDKRKDEKVTLNFSFCDLFCVPCPPFGAFFAFPFCIDAETVIFHAFFFYFAFTNPP